MRKACILAFVLVLPLLLIANVYQAMESYSLVLEQRNLQNQEDDIIQENKQVLAGISVLQSADRINKIVEKNDELEIIEPSQVIRIEPAKRGTDG